MKRAFIVLAAFVPGICGIAQHVKPQPYLKPIPMSISDIDYNLEFSAMAWTGDKLFIIAQREKNKFYYVLKNDIAEVLKDDKAGNPLKLQSIPVTGLVEFSLSRGQCYSKDEKKNKDVYDGIEASVIIGNSIYISVEARKDICYILKGTVNEDTIRFDAKKYLKLSKPVLNKDKICDSNDGFESMIQLNDTCMLALFELNAAGSADLAWSIDTNLKKTSPGPVIYDYARAGRERIAELCRYDDTTFYGIDFLYRYNNDDKFEPCHSKLVQLKVSGKSIAVTPVSYLFYANDICTGQTARINCVNFEGMVRFGDGLLLIADDKPSDDKCTHLYYYALK
jgi:hypothetical protein